MEESGTGRARAVDQAGEPQAAPRPVAAERDGRAGRQPWQAAPRPVAAERDGRAGPQPGQAAPRPPAEPGATARTRGVGPFPGGREAWPKDPRLDPDLLENGDARNVEDRYRYWRLDAVRADVARRALGFEVAVENLDHDFNIGSIVRTANALGASRVHVVGRRRWNRRGAMVTDRYMQVDHMDDAQALAGDCAARGVGLVGVDNVEGAHPLDPASLPDRVCLVFGSEAEGLSPDMCDACSALVAIPQRGSTRSMNVGHAAAIAMWAWTLAHGPEVGP